MQSYAGKANDDDHFGHPRYTNSGKDGSGQLGEAHKNVRPGIEWLTAQSYRCSCSLGNVE